MTTANLDQNTAYYRASARAAAANCHWDLAERQMRLAIEFYPNPAGALAKRDLEMMHRTLAGYVSAAAASIGILA